MRLFKKKDKRYNTYLDNYTNKYSGNFMLALFYIAIGTIAYLIYKVFQ